MYRCRFVRHMANHALGHLSVSALHQSDVQRPDPQTGSHQFFRKRIQQHLQRHDDFAEAADEPWHVLPGWLYTLAKAMDDGQDALVVGRPGNVQNSYATALERGPSVTDQRNRFVAAWVAEPEISLRSGALLNTSGEQLEAFQRRDCWVGPADQCHHGGRSQSATATSTTTACRATGEMRSSARTTSPPTCASRAACSCGERVRSGTCGRVLQLIQSHQQPGADQR